MKFFNSKSRGVEPLSPKYRGAATPPIGGGGRMRRYIPQGSPLFGVPGFITSANCSKLLYTCNNQFYHWKKLNNQNP